MKAHDSNPDSPVGQKNRWKHRCSSGGSTIAREPWNEYAGQRARAELRFSKPIPYLKGSNNAVGFVVWEIRESQDLGLAMQDRR